jgi:56kDa selenium binding protein (SBP56)
MADTQSVSERTAISKGPVVGCRILLITAVMIAGCRAGRSSPVTGPELASSRYLFVWAGDADKRESDFLAVVDVDRQSPGYAQVVTTLPVGAVGTRPHHTEYEMPSDGLLWANGFAAGRTFQFDLRDPTRPRLVGWFGDAGPFSHPHSFARLPGGNVLATFQHRIGAGMAATGGIVELDSAGQVVRYASAAAPGVDTTIRPYSLAVVPALDRVVTTATDMHLAVRSRAVQIWRLSDLALLHTLLLPPGPRGDENWLTAEPRVLADGRTVLVNTFTCGLYRLRGLEGDAPRAEWVYSTPWTEGRNCAVPVVAGHFWLQTSGVEHAVVSLDISDPSHPREASRLTLQPDQVPHWIALEPSGQRLVITGYRELEQWVLLADLDPATGALQLDTSFKAPGAEQPGVDFGRDRWPHGATGPAVPHGAVFARP